MSKWTWFELGTTLVFASIGYLIGQYLSCVVLHTWTLGGALVSVAVVGILEVIWWFIWHKWLRKEGAHKRKES